MGFNSGFKGLNVSYNNHIKMWIPRPTPSQEGQIVSLCQAWEVLPAARLSTAQISSSLEHGSCFTLLNISSFWWI